MKKKFRYIYGWIFVRPRKKLFSRMVGNWFPIWYPRRRYGMWYMPNIHWWLLYKTLFKFLAWLYWDGWRKFAKYENGHIRKTFIASVLHRIAETTAGAVIWGHECYHCGSREGCPVELSDDETGTTFILLDTWFVSTMEGTDHRFSGTTICPKCGYRSYYEDGSL